MKRLSLISLCFCLMLVSCWNGDKHKYLYFDPYVNNASDYQLAKAIEKNNLKKIDSIIQNDKSIIDRSYSTRYYSVLHFAVELERDEAARELLKNGFNPNVETLNGETPLHIAAGFPQIVSYNSYRNTKLIDALLDYGADTELLYSYQSISNLRPVPLTPLMMSIKNSLSMSPTDPFYSLLPDTKSGETLEESLERRRKYVSLEKTKVLVEKGKADVNHKTKYGITAAILALYYGEIEKAHYLIVQHKANVTDDFFLTEENYIDGIPTKPVELLRKLDYPKDSVEQKLKLEIIEEFKNQGVDYYAQPESYM